MTVHRMGIWNADNFRPPRKVARQARRLIRRHNLDILVCVEAGGYAPAMRRALGPDWRVVTRRGADSLICVRRDLRPRHVRHHDLHTGGWERSRERQHLGHHPGRTMISVQVGRPGSRYRIGAVHLPPGPHYSRSIPMRGQAFTRGVETLLRITDRWNDRRLSGWVLAGDWNAEPERPAIWQLMADPDVHAATKGGIDYAITNLPTSRVRHVKAGGDHRKAVVLDVHT